jgi:hypothetical protein
MIDGSSTSIIAILIVSRLHHQHESLSHVFAFLALGTAAKIHVAGKHHKEDTAAREETDLSVVAEIIEESLEPVIAKRFRLSAVDVVETVDQFGV